MRDLGTRFTLNDRDAIPHLSLYMANISPQNLDRAKDALAAIAERTPPIALTAASYAINAHGMTEIFYEKTPEITRLQEDVLTAVNPLREGLRERDPVGRSIQYRMRQASGELARNFDVYGYDEIGSYFNPHITLTRLIDPTCQPVPPDLSQFDAKFRRLAFVKMGEHGTVKNADAGAEWQFGARATAKDGASGRTLGREASRLGREQRESPHVATARQPDR